jgi:hypothetical protein
MDSLTQIRHLEQRRGGHGLSDVTDHPPQEPPHFTQTLPPTKGSIGEGGLLHLECQVRPLHDNTMRIEWYRNGQQMPHGKSMWVVLWPTPMNRSSLSHLR